MNLKRGVGALREGCRRKTLNRFLENYIKSCRSADEEEKSSSQSKKKNGRFPNLAGFCRFYHISLEDIERLSSEFPEEIAVIYAVLEDEALNSGLPPAVLSAYLKKRLGYDKDAPSCGAEQINLRFEHDVYADGE